MHFPDEHSYREEHGSQSPFGGAAAEVVGVLDGADEGTEEEEGVGFGLFEGTGEEVGVTDGTGEDVGVREGTGEDVGVAVDVVEGRTDLDGVTDGEDVGVGDGFGKHFSSDSLFLKTHLFLEQSKVMHASSVLQVSHSDKKHLLRDSSVS